MPSESTSRRFQVAATLVLAVLSLAAAPTAAQERETPAVAAIAGVGQDMGWFGGQAEAYVMPSLAIFAGVGWTPELRDDNPTGPTFAFGVRQYAGGRTHRGFLEAGISQVMVVVPDSLGGGDRYYGPGIQAGYSFASAGGLSALISAGIGYALGVDAAEETNQVAPLFGIGLGYIWRK